MNNQINPCDELYDENDLKVLEAQEQALQFSSFQSADALALGCELARTASEYDREVAIRIVRESDETILFQYVMDSKNSSNLQYMEGKRAAVKACGHTSFWAYVDHALHGKWQELFDRVPAFLPCAGAFPICVGKQWTATLMVSGLHNGQDHELIIRSLSRFLHTVVPEFTKTIV